VINTWPGGAEDASALVRNLGYSFKLAHAPEGWKHSMGKGANFLIDQQRRIVFRLHFNGPSDLKAADRLIAGLLRHEQRPTLRRRDRIPAENAGVAES
jgi:hypothetical protein